MRWVSFPTLSSTHLEWLHFQFLANRMKHSQSAILVFCTISSVTSRIHFCTQQLAGLGATRVSNTRFLNGRCMTNTVIQFLALLWINFLGLLVNPRCFTKCFVGFRFSQMNMPSFIHSIETLLRALHRMILSILVCLPVLPTFASWHQSTTTLTLEFFGYHVQRLSSITSSKQSRITNHLKSEFPSLTRNEVMKTSRCKCVTILAQSLNLCPHLLMRS